MDKELFWRAIAALELAAAAIVILLDLFVPTLVILCLIAVSLLVRREGLSSIGFKDGKPVFSEAGTIFLLVIGWSLFVLAFTMPVLNHLTGTTQNLSDFADLKGNFGKLAFLLFASWTLAAFGEEMVYRGFLQKRVIDIFGRGLLGIILAVGISSILFGLAHTEQGVIGVVLTFLDAVFVSLIKLKYDNNLWASVLAHGFNNTVGLVTFFLVGPIYGFW